MAVAGVSVLRGRWLALLGSILIMAASGGTYVFGIYSKAIRTSLGYDQKTLNKLSVFKNLGASLGGLPAGFVYEVAPTWSVLLFGAAMNLAGYLPIYFAITKDDIAPPPPVWRMCLCITIGAASQAFATTSALVSSVRNFPNAGRGVVLGMLMGYGGLSGAIFTLLGRCFAGDGEVLVMLIGCLASIISLLFAGTVRCIPPRATGSPCRGRERRALVCIICVSVFVGVYILAVNVVEQKVQGIPKPSYNYITATVLVVLAVSFLLAIVVFHQEIQTSTPATAPNSLTTDEDETPSTSATDGEPPLESVSAGAATGGVFSSNPPARGQDHSVPQALFSMDMLHIFGISGLQTAMDNLGQIGESLGYDQVTVSMLVSLTNISSYAGRVVGGCGSEYVVGRYGLPRPLALTVTLVVACLGHVLIALGVRQGLYAASVMVGFSLGAQWPVLFAITSEVFGLKHFSTLYNLVPLATPLGSYILSVQVTGRLYDQEAHRQGGVQCMGVQCFKVPFLAIAGTTILAVVASLSFAWRTREFYDGAGAAAVMDASDGDSVVDSTQPKRSPVLILLPYEMSPPFACKI